MKVLIVTGMSGAGKSQAVKNLEEFGYFCVDNMPPALITKFAELYMKGDSQIEKIALMMDIRGRSMLKDLGPALQELEGLNIHYQVLFLDATDACLINRFKETRRLHPLSKVAGSLEGAIQEERRKLTELKKKATYVVDTTGFSARDLQTKLSEIFLEGNAREMLINVVSFGFKRGVPQTCDLVMDVRFLPNPYYEPDLRPLTGKEKAVRDYALDNPDGEEFLHKMKDMVNFLIPLYIKEGKAILIIGIGCTGGKHRSVAVAEELGSYIQSLGYTVQLEHRDVLLS